MTERDVYEGMAALVRQRQEFITLPPEKVRVLPFTPTQHLTMGKAQLNERLGGVLDRVTIADQGNTLDLDEALTAFIAALAHFGAAFEAKWTLKEDG